MATSINRLTAKAVTNAKDVGLLSDGGGLYLKVGATRADGSAGPKAWTFIYKRGDKRTELGLGALADVSLATARERAQTFRQMLADGKDPKAERAIVVKTVPTFKEMADEIVAALTPGFRNAKHAAQWGSTLEAYAKPLHAMPINEVAVDDVLRCLKPIWLKVPETAARVRGRIEKVLDAATARGLRSGINPAAWKGNLSHLLPSQQKLTRGHHAALPYRDTPEFIGLLRARTGMAALCLEFTILTAARSGEARGAVWPEIDLQAKVWTVPAARMKAGKEHRVPLCERALAILHAVEPFERPDGLVFPGTKVGAPLSDMTLGAVLSRMKRDDLTAHGFRSTFRDWAAETTHFSGEVVEMALAHTVRNAVEAAYRRGDLLDKRRELMTAWANYCEPVKADNVVPLMTARAS